MYRLSWRSSLLLILPMAGLAATPWEAYISRPTPAAASKVTDITYTTPPTRPEKIERDLLLLGRQVRRGEPEAIRLALRLREPLAYAAALSEDLQDMLGASIKSNPRAYLSAVSGEHTCPGVFPSGPEVVDNAHAFEAETKARVAALTSVRDPELAAIRDLCLSKISRFKVDGH